MPLVLENPNFHGTGQILDDPQNTYIAGVRVAATDPSMQRLTDFGLSCTGSTVVPTTANTVLTNGNDTLIPSSVSGAGPYNLVFPVGDLSKQVGNSYVWTLVIDEGTPETADTEAVPLVIQAGWSKVDLTNPSFVGDSVLKDYSALVAVTDDDLEYEITSVLDTGVNFSINANGDRVVVEDNAGDWVNTIELNIRVVQLDGTIGATEQVLLGSYNDLEAPVITLTGPATLDVDLNGTYTEQGATWTDNVDGSGAANVSGAVDTSTLGDYVISYDYTDVAGNVATTVTRTVTVVDPDVEIPVITLTGSNPLVVNYGDAYVELGATWTDDIDGSGNVSDITGAVDVNTIGDYVVYYNFTDASGKAATTVTRTVQVRDIETPVISLTGDAIVTLEAGDTYVEQGATWTDNRDGSGAAVSSGSVNNVVVGSYTISYNYTDAAGNVAATVNRTVNVVDTTPATIELQGLPTVVVQVNGLFNDEGAIWTDAVDGQGYAEVSGNLDLTIPGSYTLYYNYTDVAGNVAAPVFRNVIVSKIQGSDDGGRYLALSKETHDLIKPFGGGVSRVVDGRFVVQQVKSKLRTWLGEWALDNSIGWINQEDFERNFDLADLERRARILILETEGVLSIVSLISKYSKRKLTLEFKAKTKYGTIELLVPWGVE